MDQREEKRAKYGGKGWNASFFLSSYAKAGVERMCTIQEFLHVANVVTLLISKAAKDEIAGIKNSSNK